MTDFSRAITPVVTGGLGYVTYPEVHLDGYESPLYVDDPEFGRVHLHTSCLMAGYRFALEGKHMASADQLLDECFAAIAPFGGGWAK